MKAGDCSGMTERCLFCGQTDIWDSGHGWDIKLS